MAYIIGREIKVNNDDKGLLAAMTEIRSWQSGKKGQGVHSYKLQESLHREGTQGAKSKEG